MINEVGSAVAQLEAAVAGLRAADLSGESDEAVLAVWRRVEAARRSLEAVDHALVAQARDRQLAVTVGARNLVSLLRETLRVGPGEAKARVVAAEAAGPRAGLTGEPLGPIYPEVASGQADGVLSAAHARVVVKAVEDLPAVVRAVRDRDVEHTLVQAATEYDPTTLARLAQRIAAHLDPDGRLVEAAERQQRREFTMVRRPDGSSTCSGEQTAQLTGLMDAVFDSLGAPAPDDGGPDLRTPGQRRHDALVEALRLALRTGDLPPSAGVATTVVLTMTAAEYEARRGFATTGHGGLVPVSDALGWVDDATQFIGVLFGDLDDPDGPGIRAVSSPRRLFTAAQRRAIHARDGGCSFPGCDAPPGWTQIHHVIESQDGGPTHTDNGTAVCGYHHRHFDRLGWRCRMRRGYPEWIPPPHIDPARRPRRNRMHHPEPTPP